MAVVIVTGSGGLVGSETVRFYIGKGFDVIGLDNDMRARLFGPEASTAATTSALSKRFRTFRSLEIDIRDFDAVEKIFRGHARDIALVVHAAAQPSHDWAAREPHTDFGINATGTLNLLQAARKYSRDVPFIFVSTNKVYGDRPNLLPLSDKGTRFDLPKDHEYWNGVPTSMGIDRCTHSLFGVSKLAADLLVQEYGRSFELPTVCFRAGCLTGPAHAGTPLHGFLSYLMKCVVAGERYVVLGYEGKQVRDNMHAADLVQAFEAYREAPRPAAVYNVGGGRENSVSLLEAIDACQRIAERELEWELSDQPRVGDHRWWISSLIEFKRDYPAFTLRYGIEEILRELHDANAKRRSEVAEI
jgi:CDP-paratose 2-epimerase